jgi:hypothetical protein
LSCRGDKRLRDMASISRSWDFLLSSELSLGTYSESKLGLSHHSASSRIMHVVFFAHLNSKPANMI